MKSFQKLFFCFSLILIHSAISATAQTPTKQEIEVIAKCVENRGGGYPAMACYGEVTEECIGEAYQNSKMVYCAVQEYMIWDQRLNAAYQKIMKVAKPQVKTSLKSAQKSWIKFRDETCSANAMVFEGGTLASLIMADCLSEQTAVRSLQLEQFITEADLFD
ncbi:hypothetical protein PsAD2_00634 [Pseudovibrio axinellae]|uniref:Lysozyme inhibitor LprI-like N-terminal domain-containing protein n=2 Tax=Pseudovibrio axinellae TaxID=989403 RepID=A0A161XHF4_9HYPH|nr:hypothetical protein PsAD2_00634 [Pseudovibrio axinellae]SEQ96862.1 Uncharacterized conserved protein YecT, DUF1311 family [Pseudovibrio axinellae]